MPFQGLFGAFQAPVTPVTRVLCLFIFRQSSNSQYVYMPGTRVTGVTGDVSRF